MVTRGVLRRTTIDQLLLPGFDATGPRVLGGRRSPAGPSRDCPSLPLDDGPHSRTQLGRSPEGPSRFLCTLHENRAHIGTPLAKQGRRVAKPSVRARQGSSRHPKRGLQLPIIPPPRTPNWQTSPARRCQPGAPEEDCKAASWAWRKNPGKKGVGQHPVCLVSKHKDGPGPGTEK